MKRTITLAVMLALLSAGLVFAAGNKESAPALAGAEKLELVKLSGTVHQDIGRPLVLKSGGKDYSIMLPMMVLPEISISQGESVTVEGYLFPVASGAAAGSLPVLQVTRATLQGKEYVFVGGGRAGMMGMHSDMAGRASRPNMMAPGAKAPGAANQGMMGRSGRFGRFQNE